MKVNESAPAVASAEVEVAADPEIVWDVLTSIDDRWTSSIHDVFAAAADVAPGQAVAVVVRRDGKELVLTLRPEDGA